MANIRAGVAYIDVRLGSIEKLKKEMKDQIEGVGAEAGKKAGEQLGKQIPASAKPEKIGSELSQKMSQTFFKDSGNSFTAGFRALSTGQLSTARALFADAGRKFGTSLSAGFQNISTRVESALSGIVSGASRMATAVGNAATTGWSKFQEFGKMLDRAAQKMGFLSFQIQNFGILASAAFTAPIAAATTLATVIGVKTAAKLEQATAALKFLLPAGFDVEKLLQRLKKLAIESPIFDTSDLITYTQKFTAAGVEISKTEKFLEAFSNIALVTGANTDEANRAIVAITQVFGKGKLQAEELNQQLGEAMPATLKLLRDQFGVNAKEFAKMVKEGKISGDDLIEAFTKIGNSKKFLEGAAAGAQTLNGVWQQFKESLQTQLGEFFLKNSQQIKDAVNKLGPAISSLITNAGPIFLKMISGFGKLVDIFAKVVDWYSKLSPGTQDLILKLIAIGTVVGPVVLILGSLLGAIAGISAGIAAIATPLGGIIIAVVAVGAALAVAIVWLKKFLTGNSETAQKIRAAWNDFYAKNIGPIVDSFKILWENVVQAFNQIKNSLTQNTAAFTSWWGFLKERLAVAIILVKAFVVLFAGVFKTIIDVLGPVIKAIISFVSGIIKIFKGITDFLIGVFTGDWSRAWMGIKEIWDGIWDAIIGTLVNLVKAIVNLVKGLVTSVVNFFKSLYNSLVGHSIIPDLVNGIINWFKKLIAPIQGVINTVGSILRGFASVVSKFAQYFYDGVNKATNFFKALPGKIISAVGSLTSKLYSLGVNAMEGFLNGLGSLAGRVYAKARSIADTVKSAIKGALGIASPSKVFKEYGRNVVQGFVLGLSGEQRNLSKSMAMFDSQPRFDGQFGSVAEPLHDKTGATGLSIENYYANDNVDPWRQAEDWYFMVTSRGGAA